MQNCLYTIHEYTMYILSKAKLIICTWCMYNVHGVYCMYVQCTFYVKLS